MCSLAAHKLLPRPAVDFAFEDVEVGAGHDVGGGVVGGGHAFGEGVEVRGESEGVGDGYAVDGPIVWVGW